MCDRFPQKFDVQTSHKPSNYVLGLIFVVNIKFPQATYHTIVSMTEELYCSNRAQSNFISLSRLLGVPCTIYMSTTKILDTIHVVLSPYMRKQIINLVNRNCKLC